MVNDVQRDAFIGITSGYLASLLTTGYGFADMVTVAVILSFLPTVFEKIKAIDERVQDRLEDEEEETTDGPIEYDWSTNRAS